MTNRETKPISATVLRKRPGGVVQPETRLFDAAIAVAASNNLVSGWTTPPGRFLTTVSQMGFVPLFAMAIVLIVLGLVIMAIEYFKKGE